MPRHLLALLALFMTLLPGAPATAAGWQPGSARPAILTADQAMQVEAFANPEAERVEVIFTLAPQVYLYQHSLGFRLLTPDGRLLDDFEEFQLPPGDPKDDQIFGAVEVYYQQLSLRLPLLTLPSGDTVLEVTFQGCLDNTLCYPPQEARLPLSFADGASDGTADGLPSPTAAPSGGLIEALRADDAGTFQRWLTHQSLGQVLLLFLLGGILLAFTPCVFPMVPILSGILAGQSRPSALRGLVLSSIYVLGMALPFTLAGLLVALFGARLNLQYLLQQPLAILFSSALFLVLGLAMFGVFTLQLPAALQQRLEAAGPRRSNGSPLAAAVLGAISGLVVSPCVTPILAAALVYVGSTGDALTGALSLFALALGMGVPLILFGTGGSHLLPRAGAWMDDIRHGFGVIMVAVAIWLLGRMLSPALILALYGALLLIYAVTLGALDPARRALRRGLALVLALYGASLFLGGLAGHQDPLQPLAAPPTPATPPASEVASGRWQTVVGPEAFQQQLQQARQAGRPVLVDFYAEWCVACRVLEATTLADPRVLATLEQADTVLLRVDLTRVNRDNQALMARFDVFGLPTLMFLDRRGEEVQDSRVLGDMSADRFLAHLESRVIPAN